MLNNLLQLDGVSALSKQELQSVNGGICRYYDSAMGYQVYVSGASAAQAMLRNANDHWCCDSCGSASWRNMPFLHEGPE